jgi:hypothetical protein
MMHTRAKKVFYATSMTFAHWTIWYLTIFLLIHTGLSILFAFLEESQFQWAIMDSGYSATRIYFLVLGLLSMGGFLTYFVSNGVTRKNYFVGMCLTLFCLGLGTTAIIGLLHGVERVVLSWIGPVGWLSSTSIGAENVWNPIGAENVSLALIMIFFQFILYYLIGWFISAGFYHHWLAGFGCIAVGFITVATLDFAWGNEGHLPLSEWLAIEPFSPGMAVLDSSIVALLYIIFMRLLTKNAVVQP